MKKLIIFLSLISLFSGVLKAQSLTDTISLNEGNFHTAFSISGKYPVKVYWYLTADNINCSNPLKRSNKFTSDPQVPGTDYNADYSGAQLDRGHNMDASDSKCAIPNINAHCWHFTNMTPQEPNLNRIVWKALEDKCREWVKGGDSLFIECGSYGFIKTIGPDKVTVPAYCWKYVKHKDGHVDAYIMPNTPTVKQHDFTYYLVTTDQLQKATGLTF